MKPAISALAIASGLTAVSLGAVAFVLFAPSVTPFGGAADDAAHHAGADAAAIEEGWAGDGHHNGDAGMERPLWPEAAGKVPSASQAQNLEQVSQLVIRKDADFAPASGVRSGTGTLADPFVISGYYVTGDLYIADTDACFIVRENYIDGQLTLNWNGQCTWVHHNYVRDLRVNENNDRTGYATGGLLELNKIQYVGQLRHYDGEFRNNVVGPYIPGRDIMDPIQETVPWLFGSDPRVANVDGFNQGVIHHNTFYGSVDLDLHGHHHGTGFFAPHSHYHGGDMNKSAEHMHDHTQRWTSVAFTDNLIVDEEGYGLRYEDRAHAGDDRTANSEEEETLEDPHRHYTHVTLARNTIEGGQLWVDVFNADDELHYDVNPGWLDIVDNTVSFRERVADGPLGLPFFGAGAGYDAAIRIVATKEVEMTVTGNTVEFLPAASDGDDGPLGGIDLWPFDDGQETLYKAIYVADVRDAVITLAKNTMAGFYYGIYADRMDEGVTWTVDGNDFGSAQYAVFYDESVANAPTGDDV
jgi:hypothetical protein